MNLITLFNGFQKVSEVYGLSANARSLYFAILSEFNKARFPTSLKLENTYLQHLSGIKASSSFDSARNALINRKIISHKHSVYKILEGYSAEIPMEYQRNFNGKTMETPSPGITISTTTIKRETEKEKETQTPYAGIDSFDMEVTL